MFVCLCVYLPWVSGPAQVFGVKGYLVCPVCSAYPDFDFEIPSQNTGDTWARAYVALQEMRESVKIIRQVVKKMPSGSCQAEARSAA